MPEQEAGEVSGESPAEVTQPLTRLSSAGTAACCLDSAFGSGDLAAAMEAKFEPLDWTDRGQEGAPMPPHSLDKSLHSACLLVALVTPQDQSSIVSCACWRSLMGRSSGHFLVRGGTCHELLLLQHPVSAHCHLLLQSLKPPCLLCWQHNQSVLSHHCD